MFILLVLVLITSQLAGGATIHGAASDLAIQSMAALLLAASAWSILDSPDRGRAALLLVPATPLGIAALQVAPFDAIAALGSGFPLDITAKAQLSRVPDATVAAALSFIAPAAVFLATAQASPAQRSTIAWLLLALGAAGLALGFMQMAQGQQSPLRFYAFTNTTEAVGFFANRNHFAAHLLVTLILAAVWFATVTRGQTISMRAMGRALLWMTAALVMLLAIVAGLAMARSRAGIFLAMAALVAIGLLVASAGREAAAEVGAGAGGYSGGERARHRTPTRGGPTSWRLITVVIGALVLFVLQFGLHRILTRFEGDPLEDLRIPLALTSFDALRAALPFGTGLGSFVPVYAAIERPEHLFGGFANRAHNDLAEILLETGAIGAVALLVFVLWFMRATWRAWSGRTIRPDNGVVGTGDLLLPRAASIIVLLLLAHSLVDYPLRTGALAVAFAFCCGLLIQPPGLPASSHAADTTHREGDHRSSRHHGSGRRASPGVPSGSAVAQPAIAQPAVAEPPQTRAASAFPSGTAQLTDVQWPKDWHTPAQRREEPTKDE